MQHCHLPVRCRWVLPYTVVLICLVIGRITLRHNGRTCQPLTSNNPLCPLPPTKIGRNLQWISVGILWLHCVVLLFLGFQRFFLQICVLTTTPTAPRSFVSVFSTIYGGQFSTDWKLLVKKSTVGWAAFKVRSQVRWVWWPPCTRICWLWVSGGWTSNWRTFDKLKYIVTISLAMQHL